MKAVASHPLPFVAARDRQQARHTRQVMMKSGVEARHLRKVGESVLNCLGQQDLLRQVRWSEWAETVQFLKHLWRDAQWFAVHRPTMHHPVPNGGQCIMPTAVLNPIHQYTHRDRMIRRLDRTCQVVCRSQPLHPKVGLWQSNPLDPALQYPSERVTGFEQRELDARRSTVDRQDTEISGFQG